MCANPDKSAICRLKKGAVKKVLLALANETLGVISAEQSGAVSKAIMNGVTSSFDKFDEMLSTTPNRTRVTKLLELVGATSSLGFDRLLQLALEKTADSKSGGNSSPAILLDRDSLYQRWLVSE